PLVIFNKIWLDF
uniref:Uncharacterized protein n=1 Tax=Amphimedon queenslandica TaxID=400682 RepID=A0A1X7UDK3_AMPQE